MKIIVNGIEAAIKEGSSFDYISDNRLFSGADGYTLSITFPLRNCENNVRIFGRLHRPDVHARDIAYKCELRDRNFLKSGALVIVEKNEIEVKAQFLEGRSSDNYKSSLSEILICDMDLGEFPDDLPADVSPASAWDCENEFVALPWVNDLTGNIQNLALFSAASRQYTWSEDVKRLSWQIYLIGLTKKIAAAIGYKCDFSAWEENGQMCRLLCCNTLPGAWEIRDINRVLPRWSVEEYFSNLELFLNAEFDFDHPAKTICMRFTEDVLRNTCSVKIDSVVREYSATIKNGEENVEYRECRNLQYKSASHNMWSFYSCRWFVESWKDKAWLCKSYDTMAECLAGNKNAGKLGRLSARNSNLNKIIYVKEVDMYFVLHAVQAYGERELANGERVPEKWKIVLQPINEYGERVLNESQDADADELEFVPVCIDYTNDEHRFCMFLAPNSYGESDGGSSFISEEGVRPGNNGGAGALTFEAGKDTYAACRIIEGDGSGEKAEYYDTINVGYWDGMMPFYGEGLPHPLVSGVTINDA